MTASPRFYPALKGSNINRPRRDYVKSFNLSEQRFHFEVQ